MTTGDARERLRALPSVDRLLREPGVQRLLGEYEHSALVEATRATLEEVREQILAGKPAPSVDELAALVGAQARLLWQPSLVPVINATGVIIHTNLGRAPLSEEALAASLAVSRGYSNLEYDLEAGERGSRHAHVSDLLARVTGAEAAMVVNNNASAVLLALSALAHGAEVVVSRGQAVEIGGGFRIPDVLRQSGARLVEVGTTNRTYLADYEAATGEQTALYLRVHSSNFRVVGFVHEVEVEDLVALGQRRDVPVLDDLGSGALLDTAEFGLAHEPMPQRSVKAGVAVACFSGDKLLGGPQAGLIVGQRAYVERLRRHPLARAVRIDKLTLAALQVTLLHYARGEALRKVPVWRMISASVEDLERRARGWADTVNGWGVPAEVAATEATVGGGSLPGETLSSRALAIGETAAAGRGCSLPELARRLRAGNPPVVGRVERGLLLLDARTVQPGEDELLLGNLKSALSV
ncbi:MAG: L-seryl-tRNA(Sec) selenium transferase [Chloroflexota bacterium]